MELNIKLESVEDCIIISGVKNQNLDFIKEYYKCNLTIRGDKIIVDLEDENIIAELNKLFNILTKFSRTRKAIDKNDLLYIINMIKNQKELELDEVFSKKEIIFSTYNGRNIYYKTAKQKFYFKALEKNDLVFSIGSAGTGKTYLAVLYAVKLLKENKIKKIILTRPAVEAGESLGFLPGDLKEKVDPYLRPIYDCLYEFLGLEIVNLYIEKQIIEIAPLAYMRGRTLEQAVVILDEAQNTTNKQMMMFLTRLGVNSKMIITGDITQIDLPKGVQSGLLKAISILDEIPGIEIVHFEKVDVIRHPLVQKIIEKYEEN